MLDDGEIAVGWCLTIDVIGPNELVELRAAEVPHGSVDALDTRRRERVAATRTKRVTDALAIAGPNSDFSLPVGGHRLCNAK